MNSTAPSQPTAQAANGDSATPHDATPHDASALARGVREAQRTLAAAGAARRDTVLHHLARLLDERADAILAANARDLADAERDGVAAPLRHRLALSSEKLATLRQGVEQLRDAGDPVGRPLRHTRLDDGLTLRQVTSPLGVLLVIFESRPDAVVQIGSLALRAGDGVILKGGSEAKASNRALVGCLRDALEAAALDPRAVAAVEGREAVAALLDCSESIDLVIPRGSGELVRTIQESTRIPVLGHAEGICHLLLDAKADPEMATRMAVDGKCDYPAACNATETLLVHREFLPHLGTVGAALSAEGVKLLADTPAREALEAAGVDCTPSDADTWSTEHGDLVLGVATVDSLDQAIDHVHRWGSGHTDAICTQDRAIADEFLSRVDSASVFWNASTRFADGFRYGLGAEVGISTGRIHARGPVGVDGLLTSRWLLEGEGQVAGDYGGEGREFLHETLPL